MLKIFQMKGRYNLKITIGQKIKKSEKRGIRVYLGKQSLHPRRRLAPKKEMYRFPTFIKLKQFFQPFLHPIFKNNFDNFFTQYRFFDYSFTHFFDRFLINFSICYSLIFPPFFNWFFQYFFQLKFLPLFRLLLGHLFFITIFSPIFGPTFLSSLWRLLLDQFFKIFYAHFRIQSVLIENKINSFFTKMKINQFLTKHEINYSCPESRTGWFLFKIIIGRLLRK